MTKELIIGLALPGSILITYSIVYAWGRWMFGDQWYLAFGRIPGEEHLDAEAEDAAFTSLNLNKPAQPSAYSEQPKT